MLTPHASLRPPLFVALLAIVCALALTLSGCDEASGRSVVGAGAGGPVVGLIQGADRVLVQGQSIELPASGAIDADTGAPTAESLDSGMVADVELLPSHADRPVARALQVHPLLRGAVDATDLVAGRLTVLGQAVQLSAGTAFSDHRACLEARPQPCAPVVGLADLRGPAVPAGHYVRVHGRPSPEGRGAWVATLVAVADAPTAPTPAAYKVEGVVSAMDAATGRVTIGALSVDLRGVSCAATLADAGCAAAVAVGQGLSVWADVAPATRPVRSLVASGLRRLPPAALAFPPPNPSPTRMSIRASTRTSAPASPPTPPVAYGLEGDYTHVGAGEAAQTYQLRLLGQMVVIDAATRLVDRSARAAPALDLGGLLGRLSALSAQGSRHLLVTARPDGAGQLHALALTLLPASPIAALSGRVDASPAPVQGHSAARPTTFSVLGVPVTAAPAAVAAPGRRGGVAALTAGDHVLVRGAFGGGTLVVPAPRPEDTRLARAGVINLGLPGPGERPSF
jgi:hypothetical protein